MGTPVSYLGLYAKHALGEVTLNFLSRECFQSLLDGEIACASDSIGKLGRLGGSQKRASLCTSLGSVTIVSHCFTGCNCSTMLCGVVSLGPFVCARIKFGHNLEAIPFCR